MAAVSSANRASSRLAVLGDQYLSGSSSDVVHSHVVAAANWNLIYSLVKLLHESKDNMACKAVTLQHLSNGCHDEFCRAKKTFKRQVSAPDIDFSANYF
jgi:hypothetical protein